MEQSIGESEAIPVWGDAEPVSNWLCGMWALGYGPSEGIVNASKDMRNLRTEEHKATHDNQDDEQHDQDVLNHPLA